MNAGQMSAPCSQREIYIFELWLTTSLASNPAIYYIHGGGWLIGSFPMYSTYLKNMALETGSIIVAPEYRLAPEHPFPAPFDDCMEGIEHVFKHAQELQIDPTNIVLSGDSTGATMALSISFTMASQENRKFKGNKYLFTSDNSKVTGGER